jgi:acid stress-induced BolA-like protein IbaG/YrbA
MESDQQSLALAIDHAKKHFAITTESIIVEIGSCFEKMYPPTQHQHICNEICNVLKEEIDACMISTRTIRRYCPLKWKNEGARKISLLRKVVA